MNTYTQKQEIAPRVANNNAASLMDTSLRNASLQRKADMANVAVQRRRAPRAQAPYIRNIVGHAHKHGYTNRLIRLLHRAGRNRARMFRGFYNIPVNNNGRVEFIGMRANGTVAHAGPFGKKLTAQL